MEFMPSDPKESAGCEIQPRDLHIFRSLLESRVMNLAHVSALHFDGQYETAKKRLQKLKAAGFVRERERKVSDPGTLFIGRKGLDALHQAGTLAEYPPLSMDALVRRAEVQESTIAHELEVMDTKVAFHSALKSSGQFYLEEFSTWPVMYQFQATPYGFEQKELTVKPDAYIRIREKEPDGGESEHSFYLEHDLSTEPHETLLRKAASYFEYFRSGGFAVWNGGERDNYREYPFWVLMAVKTPERRNTLAEQLAHHVVPLARVYVSTHEEVKANPLGAIWIRPTDYLKAVAGSPYEKPRKPRYGQAKQTDRDRFVEGRISKIHILT